MKYIIWDTDNGTKAVALGKQLEPSRSRERWPSQAAQGPRGGGSVGRVPPHTRVSVVHRLRIGPTNKDEFHSLNTSVMLGL